MREEVARILGAINDLAPDTALLVLCVCVEETPLGEAAKKLGITPEVASRRLYRAKQILRERLTRERKHFEEW